MINKVYLSSYSFEQHASHSHSKRFPRYSKHIVLEKNITRAINLSLLSESHDIVCEERERKRDKEG